MGKARNCPCGKGWRPGRIRALPRVGGILWQRSWPLAVGARRGDCRSWDASAQGGREHLELPQSLGFTRAQPLGVATGHHVFRRWAGAAFAAVLTPGARAVAPDKMSVLAGDARYAPRDLSRDIAAAGGD